MQNKNLLLTFFLLTSILFLNSCSKENAINEEINTIQIDYQLMKLAYYRDMPEGDQIGFRFYESPRIITVSKEDSHLQEILSIMDAAKASNIPVRITINENAQLLQCGKADESDLGIYAQNNLRESTIAPPHITALHYVPNMDTFDSVFAFMSAQGCATGTATIDQCISFQYVVDGCYARAHKMRQIMYTKYRYSSEKILSYEGATGYLAVDAGDCCVYWWYHIAPYVKVKTETGFKKYVMDPSMFDHPVTAIEWTSAQENLTCSPYADFGYSEIRPGQYYSPGDESAYQNYVDGYADNFMGGDPHCNWANWTLEAYSGLSTCD